MKITAGLFSHMVLQRTKQNVCDAWIEGTCRGKGRVQVRVRRGGRTLRGFNRVSIGRATGRRFSARLRGLPRGGPYEIELRLEGHDSITTARDVLVGDVWVLGGQSNMQGCGVRKGAATPHPLVRAFFMDDHWAVAEDPIHNLWDAVDAVHEGLQEDRVRGVGPGVSFAKAMLEHTGVPQGLIACAHGGTSMSQWDPSLKGLGGRSLYGATVRRLKTNGNRVAGVVWYQGESDATDDSVPHYTKRLKALITAFRRDAQNPRLPFIAVQLGRHTGESFRARCWNAIQDQQRRSLGAGPHCALVPAIDLPLDDQIHIGSRGQAILGRRLARAMCVVCEGRRAGLPPIDLGSVRVQPDAATGLGNVVVRFENLEGGLESAGRPQGFTIVDDAPVAALFDVRIEGTRAVLRTALPPAQLQSLWLHYGYGVDPACTLADGSGRPVPVFGPVPLGPLRAVSPFVRSCRVSRLCPGAGDLRGLAYPRRPGALGFTRREFPSNFLDLHEQIQAAGDDRTFWFACRIRCPEPMRLGVLLGYDGPVKLWVDGRPWLHVPEGTNPAIPDKSRVEFRAAKGIHEVVVALGTNRARAWGILLRFERTDLAKRRLEKGPDDWNLPETLG